MYNKMLIFLVRCEIQNIKLCIFSVPIQTFKLKLRFLRKHLKKETAFSLITMRQTKNCFTISKINKYINVFLIIYNTKEFE